VVLAPGVHGREGLESLLGRLTSPGPRRAWPRTRLQWYDRK
jgi:hypothetical protein